MSEKRPSNLSGHNRTGSCTVLRCENAHDAKLELATGWPRIWKLEWRVYVPDVNNAFRNQTPLIDVILLHSMWHTWQGT